jgi:hypothetical protein
MDDQLRASLQAQLLDAIERRSRIEQQIQAHVDKIQDIRKALGNPYFFHPRPADDPESQARYTGYASHEPGLQLMQAKQDVQEQIAELLNRLSGLGL